MKYMLLIYLDEKKPLSETEREACYVESRQLAHEIHAHGQYLAANPLQPTAMATSVRVREGKRLVTDGPFAETHEQRHRRSAAGDRARRAADISSIRPQCVAAKCDRFGVVINHQKRSRR
jgi:hypothetical protein